MSNPVLKNEVTCICADHIDNYYTKSCGLLTILNYLYQAFHLVKATSDTTLKTSNMGIFKRQQANIECANTNTEKHWKREQH